MDGGRDKGRGAKGRQGKGRSNLLIIRNWLTGLQTYKFQDLWLASLTGANSNPKAIRVKTYKESIFQFQSEGRKRPTSQLKTVERRSFLLLSLFVLFKFSIG